MIPNNITEFTTYLCKARTCSCHHKLCVPSVSRTINQYRVKREKRYNGTDSNNNRWKLITENRTKAISDPSIFISHCESLNELIRPCRLGRFALTRIRSFVRSFTLVLGEALPEFRIRLRHCIRRIVLKWDVERKYKWPPLLSLWNAPRGDKSSLKRFLLRLKRFERQMCWYLYYNSVIQK